VIPIRGSIKQHGGSSFWDLLFGGTSCDGVAGSLRSFMADDQISAIILDIDSGGGSSYGVFELAETIMAARGTKPIVAIANSVAASAAYAIGVAADAFYCTPGGLVGSVGVYFMHQDLSKMAEEAGVKVTFIQAGDNKTRGNNFEPLTEEDVAFFQGLVDETYGQFLNVVAKGRGTTVADVKRNYGQGDVLTPTQAKTVGMIDDVLTFDEAVRQAVRVKSRPIQRRGARAEGGLDRQADAGEEETDLEDGAGEDAAAAELEARRTAFRRTQFRATSELAAADGAAISAGGS
jgi:capsid assembly protease